MKSMFLFDFQFSAFFLNQFIARFHKNKWGGGRGSETDDVATKLRNQYTIILVDMEKMILMNMILMVLMNTVTVKRYI